ncbi:TetR/AcrR family transcriptional regulator C-terminal domain-containing protein [Cytobacillus sp. Sa5YUA1]|uniref:TetR/AcrR family transcriptional regulator C-terminal domain-containing protein n=1 Tax=Cytobacillus stercorigallinarum TaxID=2762240 RepID=A0ABR8QS16_9BACI|nr:TetR-like C-terminal domain-containing protein [Cytobacillus stercorigallinarum]MBD7938342.1 TetR/AcrR family transcriptional regulator C-terminal domain-containing protein [Cytobacillus stercorigallinarum]
MTKDPRVLQTFDLLCEGFEGLLQSDPIEQINIKRLTEAAKINRTTFYLHFADLQAFVNYYVHRLFQQWSELVNSVPSLPEHKSLQEPYPGLVQLLEYIKSEQVLYHCLLVEHRLPLFTVALREWMIKFTNQGFGTVTQTPALSASERKVREVHILSGTIGSIVWWLEEEFPISSQKLAEELTLIAAKGPFYIKTENGT